MSLVKCNISDKYLQEYQYKENHPYIDTAELHESQKYTICEVDTFFDYLCKR